MLVPNTKLWVNLQRHSMESAAYSPWPLKGVVVDVWHVLYYWTAFEACLPFLSTSGN